MSGILLATADVETFGKSWVFLVKMALVALLLVNGSVLQRTERALRSRSSTAWEMTGGDPLWTRLRTTAVMSVTLWTAILLAGTILANS